MPPRSATSHFLLRQHIIAALRRAASRRRKRAYQPRLASGRLTNAPL